MIPLVLAAWTAVAGAAAPRVLVLDLRVDGASKTTASVLRDEIAADLAKGGGIDVLSTEDLRRVVDVDAQKRAVGCSDESCLAELGQALGARYIVHGSVGVIGSTTIVQLNLFDTEANKALARETAESKDLDELLPKVREAMARVHARTLGEPVPTEGVGPSGVVVTGGIVAGTGAVLAGVGGVLMGAAWGTFSNTTAPSKGGPSVADRQGAQTMGQVGTVVLGAGALAALAGGGVLAWGALE